ncbi:MAG: hypothetical protein AAF485_28515, partial [Chloroflexota bacterium]
FRFNLSTYVVRDNLMALVDTKVTDTNTATLVNYSETTLVGRNAERLDTVSIRTKTGIKPPVNQAFPPTLFNQPEVSVEALKQLNVTLDETTYLTIGGGLGSFAWVNHLVIYGVKPNNITAIGFEKQPYGRYKRLCHNSQIPDNERLRSDSGSTPDNIWGWPGYAVREIWQDLQQGNLPHAAYLTWQIFTEPLFTSPFTPKAGQVYDSIDKEAKRISWDKIWRFGRVRAIRKTDDGRYAVAYSQSSHGQRIHKIMIASYLHLAVGYSGFRFLPDLQAYREETRDFKHVVNAYETHDHVYKQLRKQGGTVLIRGRGIVASRIIQRLYEERQRNNQIKILHLMRSPKPAGAQYGQNQRVVEHHFEYQPYNFPKAAFSGDLRKVLANSEELDRKALLATWGGTTTANRKDWRQIIETGINEGWYQIRFGQVKQVEACESGQLTTIIEDERVFNESIHLTTDFIIDATGLDADLENNPLLKNVLVAYELERNSLGRLKVTPDFEIEGLRNGNGQVYACGAITLGGAYAPVDSFIGLQYAAQRSVNRLTHKKASGLKPLKTNRSIAQWIRWARGVKP